MTTATLETTKPLLPPSTHEFAEVIHRLEAGGAMLPDTPENLMQIIENSPKWVEMVKNKWLLNQ